MSFSATTLIYFCDSLCEPFAKEEDERVRGIPAGRHREYGEPALHTHRDRLRRGVASAAVAADTPDGLRPAEVSEEQDRGHSGGGPSGAIPQARWGVAMSDFMTLKDACRQHGMTYHRA